MKLVYLKKFNEAYSDECSFETFKEILFELSDVYECEFVESKGFREPGQNLRKNYSGYFYECVLRLPKSSKEVNIELKIYFGLDNLDDYLPHFEYPEKIGESSFKGIVSEMDVENNRIKELEEQLNMVKERNNKIKEIMTVLETDIIPRLQSFSNCESVSIGYGGIYDRNVSKFVDQLRICFDISKEATSN